MFKINHLFAFIATIAIMLASCKKEGEMFVIKEGSFASNSLTASSSNVILTKASENDTALKFAWPAVSFGEKVAVAYMLQLALPSDTSGPNAWANAKTFAAGNNVLRYGMVAKDLNNLLNGMGLTAGTANKIAVRVKAYVPQNTGVPSSIAPTYTNTIAMNITTYATSLYIPGGYQGWNPAEAPVLNPVEGKPGLYEGYVYMPGSGVQYFKYTNAQDWNHTNYGDGGNGSFSTDGNAGGLSVPDGGYIYLTANLNTNTWTATKTTWSIIGDATPGGWGSDTQLTYDEVNQVWKVTANMKANGSFKFRANNGWALDFGIDGTTKKLVYADNPFLGYTAGLWNLEVPSDGNYTITLDLHVSGKYTYSLVKN